ncbi:MAG: response regulator [Bacteroidales bacterium]|nr:response regulator [Bacteroidales bacterium]
MRKIIGILIMAFASVQMMAEGRQFVHINTSNSRLSSDCVKALMQDSRGYVWIGTVSGVNRYDGSRIRVYGAKDLGQASDFVTCIEEDTEGNVWVATSTGVSRYNFEQDRFFPLTEACITGECIQNMVNTMVCDPRGLMWLSVNKQGIFSYDPINGMLRKHDLTFRRFARAGDGRIWAGSYYSGLSVTDSEVSSMESFSRVSHFYDGDQVQMLKFSPSNPNILYVASLNRGFSTIDTSTGEVHHLCSLPRDTSLGFAFMEGEKRWWASTSNGVYCYDLRTGELESYFHTDDIFTISGNYTFCTMVDREGGLWVGTKDGGVDYSSPSGSLFRKYYETSSGVSMEKYIVGGFAETEDGTIWIATEQGGLLQFRNGVLSHVRSEILPKTISSLAADGTNLWIGSLTGVYRMDIYSMKVESLGNLPTYDHLLDPRAYNVFRSSKGDIYATSTRGLDRFVPDLGRFIPLHSTKALFYTDIKETSDGSFWLSSFYDGVFKIDPDSDRLLASYDCSEGLGDSRVASMFISQGGDVWAIGFSSGYAQLDSAGKKFVPVNRSTHVSLGSNMFLSCIEDEQGRMWLTSGAGLVVYNPETAEPIVYHLSDGLLDEKFTRGAFRASTGKLFFGSDNGFIVVDPSVGGLVAETPRLAITEMRVGNSRVMPAYNGIIDSNIDVCKKVRLKPGQNSFAFSFASPGQYSKALKLSQYKLEGQSSEWHTIPPDGVVIFYNVPSGVYRLLLRTRDDAGNWNESHAPLHIEVEKPFFESLPGLVLITIAILMIISGAVYVLNRHSERRRRMAEEEYRKRKEEEMIYEKMNFFSHVIHEIKTPLTLIRTPLQDVMNRDDLPENISHDLAVVCNNTEYLSDLVNELLEYVRVERQGYTLNPIQIELGEKVGSLLFNYLDTASNKGVSIDFGTPKHPFWISADNSALNKILNNILLNAVKYAEHQISISMDSEDGVNVVLKVSNDGVEIPLSERENIFKPFMRYGSSGTGFGIGLPLARSLAQMHSGTLALLDGERTCFALTLPLIAPPAPQVNDSPQLEEPSEKPVLLVVDDNEDLRHYLKTKFSSKYAVMEACSAQVALNILHERRIDLMITDISMSGMSGLELCSVVRSDIEISHLPIIVLSARTSVESKIQAMESGADLYMEKPFDLSYLRVSIDNILDRRALMRKALVGGAVQTDIKLFGLPSRDEEFFRRFDELIRDNIASPELSNSFLAANLAVSEATLIRKIRKLLDTTPTDYIRTKRLNMAAAQIKAGGFNISEIAYDLGFNSPAYFSKCFKDHFGCTPSEYNRKK